MQEDNTITHTDIKKDRLIIRFLPKKVRPYALLLRLDRPIGIWLLLLPGWWSIVLASGGIIGLKGPVLAISVLFALGAVIMRGAGCVINDLWDRRIDREVERTQGRPLASDAISVRASLIFLVLLLLIGLMILVQLSPVTVLLGFLVFPLIVLYPLMKRWTWWPQLFLGITFNFGALMGWAAVNDVISLAALLLYVGGVFWTLGYDTVYAHQDMEDDVRVGVKSTALRFGKKTRAFVTVCYMMAIALIAATFLSAGAGVVSLLLLAIPAAHLVWQIHIWDTDDPASALEVFKSNQVFGVLVLLAALL